MNRRRFFGSALATLALTTGLARARVELVEDGLSKGPILTATEVKARMDAWTEQQLFRVTNPPVSAEFMQKFERNIDRLIRERGFIPAQVVTDRPGIRFVTNQ